MSHPVSRGLAAAVFGGLLLASTPAAAEPQVSAPRPHPTWLWLATQLVPSSELAVGPGPARYGLRWQATPLLYSWGVNPKVSGWRTFVVEPNVRHFGSVELHASPGLHFDGDPSFLFRAGLRAYFPVLHRGEYLSVSVGAGYQRAFEQDDLFFDVGVYVLYGVLGLQLIVAPEATHPASRSLALTVRYF